MKVESSIIKGNQAPIGQHLPPQSFQQEVQGIRLGEQISKIFL